jgi:hypothetical protein
MLARANVTCSEPASGGTGYSLPTCHYDRAGLPPQSPYSECGKAHATPSNR